VQHGAVAALDASPDFYEAMCADYRAKRDLLADGLTAAGFEVHLPQGTYFMTVGHADATDDRAFCRRLVSEARVAAIPPSVFYHDGTDGSGLVRFAFCKDAATLSEAVDRISNFV
jgi:N-succinyldiaminopimelate aminotransferase